MRVGTTVTIVSGGFLTIGLTGILILITDVIFGGLTAAIVGVITAIGVALLWFALPLRRRRVEGDR